MRPEETLDIKLPFAGWFASKPAAQPAEMEAEAYAKQGFSNPPQDELDSLRVAQNYWVAPDMVRIAEAAQETLPDEDVLLEEPPPSHGFLVLAEPFTIRCADEECVDDHPFSGLRWRPVHRVLPATKWAEEQHDDGILRSVHSSSALLRPSSSAAAGESTVCAGWRWWGLRAYGGSVSARSPQVEVSGAMALGLPGR